MRHPVGYFKFHVMMKMQSLKAIDSIQAFHQSLTPALSPWESDDYGKIFNDFRLWVKTERASLFSLTFHSFPRATLGGGGPFHLTWLDWILTGKIYTTFLVHWMCLSVICNDFCFFIFVVIAPTIQLDGFMHVESRTRWNECKTK